MIDWNLKYGIASASEDFNKLEIKDTEVTPIKISDGWMDLRHKLITARDEIFDNYNLDNSEALGYSFDVAFGLKLHDILCDDIGFTARVANSDDVWNFLSIRVIPDIVHARHGKQPDYYYQKPRRTWLKVIWWYIRLAWTGDAKSTADLIKSYTTDTIMQMIERPGLGYYTNVYHEILTQYRNYDNYVGDNRMLFRRVLILNTARLLTTSPELVEGGVKGYVERLFRDAGGNE